MRIILLTCLLYFTTASAELFADVKIPMLTGSVVDEIGLLQVFERSQLETLLGKLDQSKKIQMAILIASSLQGVDIESFALKVAESWKLGLKGKDQGLLFVVAPRERRMRFEVGYGLEGEITDAFSRRVLDNIVASYFKQERYADGLMLAVEAIAQKLQIDLKAPVENRLRGSKEYSLFQDWVFRLFFIFIIVVFWILRSVTLGRGHAFRHGRRSNDGSGWGGGGFGGGGFGSGGGGGFGSSGGGFSGGGGGFGGGGASGRW